MAEGYGGWEDWLLCLGTAVLLSARLPAVGYSESAMPDNWVSYYWALAQEFGSECLHITRADMLGSALTAVFVFLINRNEIDFRVIVEAVIATFITLCLLHSARVPWLLAQRMAAAKEPLHFAWGVLGIFFFATFMFAIVYIGAWFYTMQPKVAIEACLPDGRDKRIVELENEATALNAKIPGEKSLKVRLLKAANDYEELWRKPPKEPICTQKNTMTPEEQRKVLAPCVAWMNTRDMQYQRFLAPEIIELIRIAKGKGADVSQDLEQCAPTGACGQNPLPLRLRALSHSLNAHDEVTH
jgi:hypothetical protein